VPEGAVQINPQELKLHMERRKRSKSHETNQTTTSNKQTFAALSHYLAFEDLKVLYNQLMGITITLCYRLHRVVAALGALNTMLLLAGFVILHDCSLQPYRKNCAK